MFVTHLYDLYGTHDFNKEMIKSQKNELKVLPEVIE